MSNKLATLIAVTNLKGGVGKSTISSILASKFNAKEDKKTCVFNIAKGQSAETINEVETIDYSSLLSIDRTISASEALASIMENYDYISALSSLNYYKEFNEEEDLEARIKLFNNVSIDDLNNGIYIISVTSQGKVTNHKIIKK